MRKPVAVTFKLGLALRYSVAHTKFGSRSTWACFQYRKPYACRKEFDRRMEPFVERARLTGKHYDVGDVAAMNVMERSRKGMNQILLRQKISELEAKWAIRETFSIAVNYKLETRRRQQRMLKQKAQEIEILQLSRVAFLATRGRLRLVRVEVLPGPGRS
jgi:hypothetical protein